MWDDWVAARCTFARSERCKRVRVTGAGALAGLVVGAGTVGFWIAQGWNSEFLGGPGVYEIIPGFIAATIAIVIVSLVTQPEDLSRHPAKA